MNNAKNKFIIPVGISALAILALQAPASAEEANAAAAAVQVAAESQAAGDQVSEALAPAANEVEAAEEDAAVTEIEPQISGLPPRAFSSEVDAYAKAEVERLDRLGIVGRQAAIGEEILLIDRQINRAEAINTLVGYLGVEGFRLSYPELADQLKDSPILLRADLARLKLQNQIDEEINGPKKAEEPAKPQPRDDGSSYFDMSQVEVPLAGNGRPSPSRNGEIDPAIAELIASQVAAAQKAASAAGEDEGEDAAPARVIADAPISLREVYGLAGNYTAVIVHGDERIRVREGDSLPNETSIESIENDAITIRRHGKEIRIPIRG